MASDLSKEAVEAVRMAALDAADVLTNSMAFNPAQAVVDLVRVTGALSAERDALAARLAEVGGRSVPTRSTEQEGA